MPFEDWLDRKFGQPPSDQHWPHTWYRPADHFETRATYAEYVVWTWEDPIGPLADRFSVAQIGTALLGEHHVNADPRLPIGLRIRAWRALQALYLDLFAKLCSGCLGHKSEHSSETACLDAACYMCWDVDRFQAGTTDDHHEDDLFFEVIGLCLKSRNATVQESALHRLGHVHIYREARGRVAKAIGDFLSSGLVARPELVRYARRARRGRIL